MPPSRYGKRLEAFAGFESEGSGQQGRMPMSPISLVARHLVARVSPAPRRTWAIFLAP